MAEYYTTYRLVEESNPLIAIFQTPSNKRITRLYKYLGCQHHLVQDDPFRAPTIPGLTPAGFERWMTIQILAYPQKEADRLAKVVENMPVDADGVTIDGMPECLPKQLSWYLLPSKKDRESRKLFEKALFQFEAVEASAE